MTTKDMGLWLVSLIIIWIITIGAIFAIIELLVPAIGGLFEVLGDMKIANTDDGQRPWGRYRTITAMTIWRHRGRHWRNHRLAGRIQAEWSGHHCARGVQWAVVPGRSPLCLGRERGRTTAPL